MKTVQIFTVVLMASFWLLLSGCAGVKTFHEVARAGDTVAVAAGWEQNFSRDKIRVTITPSSGDPIVYEPNDPAIRGVLYLYPDPLSSAIVSRATQQNITPYARTYGDMINNNFTYRDKDWWQTTVFVDLPDSLPVGWSEVYIENVNNPANEYAAANVEIVEGIGRPNSFDAEVNGPLTPVQMQSLERVGHYTVKFAGATIPYAIQVTLSHAPDVSHGGAGKTYVVNPRGDVKSVAWVDDGTTTKVMLTPAKEAQLGHILDYKFYVAGGITNLQVVDVKAVDSNGNAVSGITASIN